MNLQCTTAAFTVFPEPKDFVALCPLVPETRPSMRFLFVGSHLCARASSAQSFTELHLPSASGYHGWAYCTRSHAGSPTGDFHPISSCPCRAYTNASSSFRGFAPPPDDAVGGAAEAGVMRLPNLKNPA